MEFAESRLVFPFSNSLTFKPWNFGSRWTTTVVVQIRLQIFNTMPKDIGAYLAEQQRNSSGQTTLKWTELEELYNKK